MHAVIPKDAFFFPRNEIDSVIVEKVAMPGALRPGIAACKGHSLCEAIAAKRGMNLVFPLFSEAG